jgi:hypothetical protein
MPGARTTVSYGINIAEDARERLANINTSKNILTPNIQLPEKITYKHKRNSNTLENFIVAGW